MDTLVTPTDAYLVMELVPLLNLFDYCKAKFRFTTTEVEVAGLKVGPATALKQNTAKSSEKKCVLRVSGFVLYRAPPV